MLFPGMCPMMIQVLAVPDYIGLPTVAEVFRAIRSWVGVGFIFRIYGQEYK